MPGWLAFVLVSRTHSVISVMSTDADHHHHRCDFVDRLGRPILLLLAVGVFCCLYSPSISVSIVSALAAAAAAIFMRSLLSLPIDTVVHCRTGQ